MSEFKDIASETVNLIYDERRDFLVVGLTGRTGSGCSTVAGILQTPSFYDLSLREPKTMDFNNGEERKYSVIYNYMQENWDEFIIIKMTNIIASFLFENTFTDFLEYFKGLSEKTGCNISENASLLDRLRGLESTFKQINIQMKVLNQKVIQKQNT
jgi:dCMP deaminase